ncbi:hypothetical protein LP419_39840 [Massilia sp. H-1]|nr:hypothetical protein LP419_39840 [Massilia sp. H-1]
MHVITVNDYLAQRDADKMRPLYEFLGLSVGTVLQGQDKDVRRALTPTPSPTAPTRSWRSTICATWSRCRAAPASCTRRCSGWAASCRATARWCCAACISPSSMKPTACSWTRRARR